MKKSLVARVMVPCTTLVNDYLIQHFADKDGLPATDPGNPL